MNKLLLVRHGQSIGNVEGFIQGKSDFKLSVDGKLGVKKLLVENKEIFKGYDSIVCSTLSRAKETAILIGDETHKNVTFDPLLEELSAGVLEGLKKDDVKKIYPDYYKVWCSRGDLDIIPKAEKGDELQARVLMYLEKYLSDNYNEIIVSHAGFLRSMINTIYNRERQTAVNLDHHNIYCLNDVWKNIGVNECVIAKNSKVLEIETFDKKYIMKKISKGTLEDVEMEKQMLKYLSKEIYTPQIINFAKREGYILKIMDYATGINIHSNLNQNKINNTTTELYKLNELFKKYDSSSNYLEGDVLNELHNILLNNHDEEIRKIIIDIIKNEQFNNALKNDKMQLVHDDLHRDNILYEQDKPVFLDFEGLKKWPSVYQLASHIAANYILYDNNFNINLILEKWPEKINYEYLKNLIMFRLIKGFNYFSQRIKSRDHSSDDYEFGKIYKKSLINFSKKKE